MCRCVSKLRGNRPGSEIRARSERRTWHERPHRAKRESQQPRLAVPTITGRCHVFLPDECNRENRVKEHSRFMKSEEEQSATFALRFLRSYRLLNFIACRMLADEDKALVAILNCWQAASRNPPHFEYEGAFRSWLVRVLIDEALAILRESQRAGEAAPADRNAVSLSDSAVKPGLGKERKEVVAMLRILGYPTPDTDVQPA
jgi:hypothetical protein